VSAGRVILIILGSLISLFALAIAIGGGALIYADQALTDSSGFLNTSYQRFRSPTYALTSESLDVVGTPGDILSHGDLADVRIRTRDVPPSRPVFIGIGPTARVNEYLSGVGRTKINNLDYDPFRISSTTQTGSAPSGPPGDQTFWVAKAQGSGAQAVTWSVDSGNWSVVLMNADGTRPVSAQLSLGAKISSLFWIAFGLLIGGVVILGLGILMIVLAARRGSTAPPAPPPPDSVVV
jgi:hypothetical protein